MAAIGRGITAAGALVVLVLLTGCSPAVAPLRATDQPVDLARFMGDWYVIGFIPIHVPPLFSEQDAHNGIESYRLASDGSIATTYVFRRGAFDGPEKRFTPRARVVNAPVNSAWKMKFFWYLPAGDFLILHVDPGYREAVIGVPNRRHAWIMAREPGMSEADFRRLAGLLATAGYDTARIRRVPQRWP